MFLRLFYADVDTCDAHNSCVTFARVEFLKSFPESTKKTAVVLVDEGLGYFAQQFLEWPEALGNS